MSFMTSEERVKAQMELADTPLKRFLNESVIPYKSDDVTRLILDSHLAEAFSPISHLTVGELREWLLDQETKDGELAAVAPGLTPEMVAAVSKIMRVQDLVTVSSKRRVVRSLCLRLHASTNSSSQRHCCGSSAG